MTNKKTTATVIIQARMESTRLPRKAFLELSGKPMLGHIIERAMHIDGVDTVVLATTLGEENRILIDLAFDMGIDVFVGSQDNVLERYYIAHEEFGGDYIIRITGDNPFTDSDYATQALKNAISENADLSSFSNLPLGTAVEIIRGDALKKAYEKSTESYHFEHVTPYIKEHPEEFNIKRHMADIVNPIENLRLTVDTEEDYNLARIIYNNLYKDGPFGISEVIDFLKDEPALVEINSCIEQRPMTHSSDDK